MGKPRNTCLFHTIFSFSNIKGPTGKLFLKEIFHGKGFCFFFVLKVGQSLGDEREKPGSSVQSIYCYPSPYKFSRLKFPNFVTIETTKVTIRENLVAKEWVKDDESDFHAFLTALSNYKRVAVATNQREVCLTWVLVFIFDALWRQIQNNNRTLSNQFEAEHVNIKMLTLNKISFIYNVVLISWGVVSSIASIELKPSIFERRRAVVADRTPASGPARSTSATRWNRRDWMSNCSLSKILSSCPIELATMTRP